MGEASTATRKSEVRSQKSEVLIGKALSILSLVTYFCHPALGVRICRGDFVPNAVANAQLGA